MLARRLLLALVVAVAALAGRGGGSGGGAGRAQAHGDYVRHPERLVETLATLLGTPLNVRQLFIYPDYTMVEARDPDKHENVDRYILRDGKVQSVDPVRLSISDVLETQTFRLSDVDIIQAQKY